MKTIYTLLILLLTVTFTKAQSHVASVEASTTFSVSEVNDDVTTVTVENKVEVKEDAVLIDASQVKETIARSTSDIRIYLNRMRNVDNLNLLFPNSNKAKSV
tara:strand:+ start:37283 stop:37588 length:306 start_codon:yes stop_codon:yes gene_type:complete